MNQQYDYDQSQQQAQPSSGVSRVLIYVGVLVVVNIILIAVDAPFFVY